MGPSLTSKIEEILETGTLSYLEEERAQSYLLFLDVWGTNISPSPFTLALHPFSIARLSPVLHCLSPFPTLTLPSFALCLFIPLLTRAIGAGPSTIERWYKAGLRSIKHLQENSSVLNESQKIGVKYFYVRKSGDHPEKSILVEKTCDLIGFFRNSKKRFREKKWNNIFVMFRRSLITYLRDTSMFFFMTENAQDPNLPIFFDF